jgi:cystathionine beta-synthase
MLVDTILDAIGNTPMVQLKRVGQQLDCNLYGKCEFLNPGGSVKDRIGWQMVKDAEASGRIKPGDTLIEPTSGNTGIGIALAGAVRGYRIIITMPEKMSKEKQVVLEALGAEIIRTPTEAAFDAPDSHISVAARLQKELPNAHILDQYGNPSNPDAHYAYTGQEILDEVPNVDMIVIGAGTGGTITGVAKRLKEANPNIIVVGADPVGSILAGGKDVGTYKVEGIGYDFIPDVLDRSLIDVWVKTTDGPAFVMARRLIREEGLLCGGSSGTAMVAALQEAKKLKKGQNCVVILPDGVRNYMTKFVDDKWMQDNRFYHTEALDGHVGLLASSMSTAELITLNAGDTAERAISVMRKRGISQIPVMMDNQVAGLLSEADLLQFLSSGQGSSSTDVSAIMNRSVPTVENSTPLATLQEVLLQSGSAVVVDANRKPVSILTKIDLVEWLVSHGAPDGAAV